MSKREAMEFTCFADETFFGIHTLLLAHGSMIEIYCIRWIKKKGQEAWTQIQLSGRLATSRNRFYEATTG